MIVNTINTATINNRSNISFSGKKEFIDKSINFARSSHFSSQILSQSLAPIIFNTNLSLTNALKIKIFGDMVEAGCNLVSGNKITIKKQPTSLIAITVSGIGKITKQIRDIITK